MNKTYIWGVPTRLFHWLFAISIVLAYVLVEYNINWHVILGITAGFLSFLRIIYGLIGPKYSNFKDFPIRISKMKNFLIHERKNPVPTAGHNPLASLIMLLILIMLLFVPFTGLLTLGQEFESGFFANSTLLTLTKWEEIHELAVNLLIILVIAHLLGLISDMFVHGRNAAWKSMFSGYKTGVNKEDVKLSAFQKIFAFIWFVIPLGFILFSINTPPVSDDMLQEKGEYEHVSEEGRDNHESEDED